MIFIPRLLFLIGLWGFLSSVWAWSEVAIGRFLITAPQQLPGSCVDKGIENDLQNTITLVDHAIGVIEPLLTMSVQRDDDWINRLDMAKAMFGIDYTTLPNGRLEVVKGRSILREALG